MYTRNINLSFIGYMVYFEPILGSNCNKVVRTHVDILQLIWQLERIAFDGVMLGQFGRDILIVNHAKM